MSDRDYVKQQIHILQEKDRLDQKNTYLFYLRSLNGRDGGAGSNHNKFSFEIPAIPDMNIKDCACRIKHLVIPKATSIINANIQVECDFLKPKVFDSQFPSGLTNQNLGLFNIQKQLAEFSSNTTIAGTTFKKLINDGTIVNADAGATANAIGFIPVPRHLGFTADPINKEFTECNNPFGRKISFSIKEKNGVNLLNCGTSNAEGVYLILEVKLLPNPVESVKGNY
jgi:hypothetical protein